HGTHPGRTVRDYDRFDLVMERSVVVIPDDAYNFSPGTIPTVRSHRADRLLESKQFHSRFVESLTGSAIGSKFLPSTNVSFMVGIKPSSAVMNLTLGTFCLATESRPSGTSDSTLSPLPRNEPMLATFFTRVLFISSVRRASRFMTASSHNFPFRRMLITFSLLNPRSLLLRKFICRYTVMTPMIIKIEIANWNTTNRLRSFSNDEVGSLMPFMALAGFRPAMKKEGMPLARKKIIRQMPRRMVRFPGVNRPSLSRVSPVTE